MVAARHCKAEYFCCLYSKYANFPIANSPSIILHLQYLCKNSFHQQPPQYIEQPGRIFNRYFRTAG